MAKNLVQFQKGMSLGAFFDEYGSEEQCRKAIAKWRWPNGFACPRCGHSGRCELKVRMLIQCHRCHHQTSLTSGTLFASTKLPLRTWFLAIYFLTQSKTGISALALRRHLGVSYNTAWLVKHKLMQAMKERDDTRALCGYIQLDDAYWGGERHGQGCGRGTPGKTPFVVAVAGNSHGHPLELRMSRVSRFSKAELSCWSKHHLHTAAQVTSDGLHCFSAVVDAGCTHTSVPTGGGRTSGAHPTFHWVNTIMGNVKNAIHGTYHALNPKHLPRYLAEFCYRFNRRFALHELVARLACIATRTPPLPYRLARLAESYW